MKDKFQSLLKNKKRAACVGIGSLLIIVISVALCFAIFGKTATVKITSYSRMTGDNETHYRTYTVSRGDVLKCNCPYDWWRVRSDYEDGIYVKILAVTDKYVKVSDNGNEIIKCEYNQGFSLSERFVAMDLGTCDYSMSFEKGK